MRGRYGAIVPQGAPGNAGGGGNVPKSQQAHASNDYCQHFVDTGQRPQNFLRDTVNTDERCVVRTLAPVVWPEVAISPLPQGSPLPFFCMKI